MESELDEVMARLRRYGYTGLDELEHERTPNSFCFHAVKDGHGHRLRVTVRAEGGAVGKPLRASPLRRPVLAQLFSLLRDRRRGLLLLVGRV